MRGWRKAKSAGEGKAVVAHGSAAVVVVVVVPGEEKPGLVGALEEAERLLSLWLVGAVKVGRVANKSVGESSVKW